MHKPVTIVILAAGLGTRMKSRQAKVLHQAGGKTLLQHVVDTALELAPPERIFAVVGHQAEKVRQSVAASGIGFIEQQEQKGTGHAVMIGRDAMAHLDGYLMVLYGDSPLLQGRNPAPPDRTGDQRKRGRRAAERDHGRSHRLRSRHPQRRRQCAGHRGAEGRHPRATRHTRGQHGHLLLPRGPLLEARRRDRAQQPRPGILPHRHARHPDARRASRGGHAHRRSRRGAGHQRPRATGAGRCDFPRAQAQRGDGRRRHA